MIDFGTDVSTYPDLDPNFGAISGPRAVAECCARMLETPRGSLVYAPNRGFDLRAALNESITTRVLDRLRSGIEQEAMKDERVLDATAQLTFIPSTSTLRVVLTLTTADGPFRLVLAVTSLSLTILDGGA